MQKIKRPGMTLIEVMSITVILSVVSITAAGGFFDARLIRLISSKTESCEITTALRTARVLAISERVETRVLFAGSPENCSGFSIQKVLPGGPQEVVSHAFIDPLLKVTVSDRNIDFTPTGNAKVAAKIVIQRNETDSNNVAKDLRLITVTIAGGIIHDVAL